MTSKERAALKARANSLDALFQVGKSGVSDALTEQTDGALKTRELIKLRVLTETCPVSPRDAAAEIAAKTGAEVVQIIGGVMVLYRYNPELHKKKPAAAAAAQKPYKGGADIRSSAKTGNRGFAAFSGGRNGSGAVGGNSKSFYGVKKSGRHENARAAFGARGFSFGAKGSTGSRDERSADRVRKSFYGTGNRFGNAGGAGGRSGFGSTGTANGGHSRSLRKK